MDYLYILQTIRESSPEFFTYFFLFISEIVVKAAVVAAVIIYWCFDKSNGASILLGYSSAYSVNQLVKNCACVYRPWIKDSRLHVAKLAEKTATGYSFPSGHTITAASIFGGIGMWKKEKKAVVAVMAILVALTAFSRNWLGAHTLPDVMTAVFEAAVILCISSVFRYFVFNKPHFDTILTIAMVIVSVVILVFLKFKSYPMDYDTNGMILVDPDKMITDCYTACGMTIGGFTGWWFERHYVHFETEVGKKEKLIRALVGLVVFGVIYSGIDFLLKPLGDHFAHLLKYMLLFFIIMYVYPLCFWKFHLKKVSKVSAS